MPDPLAAGRLITTGTEGRMTRLEQVDLPKAGTIGPNHGRATFCAVGVSLNADACGV